MDSSDASDTRNLKTPSPVGTSAMEFLFHLHAELPGSKPNSPTGSPTSDDLEIFLGQMKLDPRVDRTAKVQEERELSPIGAQLQRKKELDAVHEVMDKGKQEKLCKVVLRSDAWVSFETWRSVRFG